MPKQYEAIRNAEVKKGVPLKAAKTSAAKIYNAKRKPGQAPVTGKPAEGSPEEEQSEPAAEATAEGDPVDKAIGFLARKPKGKSAGGFGGKKAPPFGKK